MVDVCDLKKTYGGWSLGGIRRIEALRGISLQADPGQVFGLLGPNGAGKTTLIKTLLGVIKPSSGRASLFGIAVGSAKARMRVGYLPESLRVDKHHTARSALNYYGRLSRMDSVSIRRRSDELLELVGLAGRDQESVRRFSKGMYQRLGLAQALMHDPDLLLLDEPTDGLDPVGRNEVRRVIERLRDLGKTIFLNSHILQEVELVCTRVAIMAKGRVLANAPIAELRSQSSSQRQLEIDVIAPDVLGGNHESCLERIRECFRVETSGSEQAQSHDNTLARSIVKLGGGASMFRVSTSPLSMAENNQTLKPSSASPTEAPPAIEQSMIDQIIDRLRTAEFSVARLERRGPTLEDTFMQLVGTSEESS